MWIYIKNVDLIQSQSEEAVAKVVICDTKRVQGWEQLEKTGIKVVPFLTYKEILELAGQSSLMADLSVLPHLDGNGNGDDILFITQSSGTLRTFLYADCTVLTPKLSWGANELASIIIQCGVTNIVLYPTFVDDILEKAKTSLFLAETLRTLRNITFTGGPLGSRAFENAKEMVRVWVNGSRSNNGISTGGQGIMSPKLVVLPTSPDCPVPALRDPIDGKYHTKDLFEIMGDGYVSHGSTANSFILENTALCDAKYIEDRISYLCHDLLSSFVVLGRNRPAPALLVEPKVEVDNTTITTFRSTLLTRLPLNSFKTEKGAVVRSKAEVMFKEMLDKLYVGDLIGKDIRKDELFIFSSLRPGVHTYGS
ncbi:hypothetical protein Clacol_003314 [Clathrus columnatus]|uniref:Uncharacterized protein n=1 Tax=Clathrus columnatus TaxID=1419009 RepID=A0AAV5A389_9AGAM|nr:hypothetical protein Clacol_003314 [Clathrus columnatus]